MFKKNKVFAGAVGAGQPFDEGFEIYADRPSAVLENLKHLRPTILAVKQMAETKGWAEHIRPFLEKQSDPRRLVALIREKSPLLEYETAKIEAFGSLLNYINTLSKTADSLRSMESEEEDAPATRD